MTRNQLAELFLNKQINRMELNYAFKEMDDDMLKAHGGTYNCDKCTYTRHINCPAHCS
jgi:hypothetical protein